MGQQQGFAAVPPPVWPGSGSKGMISAGQRTELVHGWRIGTPRWKYVSTRIHTQYASRNRMRVVSISHSLTHTQAGYSTE